jgi:hypothetical protein
VPNTGEAEFGDGDKTRGEGGTSIELWLVMPLHTVLASLDVIPGSVSVSLVRLPPPELSSSVSSSAPSDSGDA